MGWWGRFKRNFLVLNTTFRVLCDPLVTAGPPASGALETLELQACGPRPPGAASGVVTCRGDEFLRGVGFNFSLIFFWPHLLPAPSRSTEKPIVASTRVAGREHAGQGQRPLPRARECGWTPSGVPGCLGHSPSPPCHAAATPAPPSLGLHSLRLRDLCQSDELKIFFLFFEWHRLKRLVDFTYRLGRSRRSVAEAAVLPSALAAKQRRRRATHPRVPGHAHPRCQ